MSADILPFPNAACDDDELQDLVILPDTVDRPTDTKPKVVTHKLKMRKSSRKPLAKGQAGPIVADVPPGYGEPEPQNDGAAPVHHEATQLEQKSAVEMPAAAAEISETMLVEDHPAPGQTVLIAVADHIPAADNPDRAAAGDKGAIPKKEEVMIIDDAEAVFRKAQKISDLPDGFSMHPDGIYVVQSKGEDDLTEVFLCSPLRVLDRFRNRDGMDWGRRIGIVNPDGLEVRFTVLDSMLASSGSKVVAELIGRGLRKGSVKGATEIIRDLLISWNPPLHLRSTTHQGWADATCDAFVLSADHIIGNPDVIYLAPTPPGDVQSYAARGTLEDWKRELAAPCVNNPLMMTAVSLAFVGPLLEILGREGGGLHLRGRSSRGKTTLLKAAASVWGPPALVQSWRTTSNALEATAVAANSKLLVLDELGEVAGKDLFDAAYMLANGKGKARLGSFGQNPPIHRWKVALLSSGEISIAAKIAEAGLTAKAGQEVRMIDVIGDTRLHGAFDDLHGCTDGAHFATRVGAATREFHGTAGPLFVDWLIQRRHELVDRVEKVTSIFDRLVNLNAVDAADGVVIRTASWFALIAAAGHLATTSGLTGWSTHDAVKAATDVFRAWLDNRQDNDAPTVVAAVTRVRNYLSHAADQFAYLPKTGQAEISEIGWQDEHCFHILSDTWKEIHNGVSTKVAARDIDSAGYLISGEGENRMRKAPSSIPGRPRVYTVRKTILDDTRDLSVSA